MLKCIFYDDKSVISDNCLSRPSDDACPRAWRAAAPRPASATYACRIWIQWSTSLSNAPMLIKSGIFPFEMHNWWMTRRYPLIHWKVCGFVRGQGITPRINGSLIRESSSLFGCSGSRETQLPSTMLCSSIPRRF